MCNLYYDWYGVLAFKFKIYLCGHRNFLLQPRRIQLTTTVSLSMMLALLRNVELWRWKFVSSFHTLNSTKCFRLSHFFLTSQRKCAGSPFCFPVFSSRRPKHRRNCCWCNGGSAACGPTDICRLVCQKERISAWLVFHIIFKSDFYRPRCSDDDQRKVSLLIQAGRGLKSVSERSTLCWCCFLSSYYSKERKVSAYFYAFKCYLTLVPLV